MSEPAMKIMEILVRDALILNLGVRTKREVLVEMANALAKVEPQIEANRLLEVLMEREALQSTGIGEGVAIPTGSSSASTGWSRASRAATKGWTSTRSTASRPTTSSCWSYRSSPVGAT